MSVMVAGRMGRSIAEHERACLVLIEEEQSKIAPNNALISVLCDSVRMGREWVDSLRGGSTVRELFGARESLDAKVELPVGQREGE